MRTLRRGLENRFVSNVSALMISRVALAGSQVIALPILSRFLSLHEFAIVAIAMVPAIFAYMLTDAGLGQSLVRVDSFRHDEWSTVFWFLAAIGAGLTTFMALLAPIMMTVFDEPELFWFVLTLSISPLIMALTAVPCAELQHRDAYTTIAKIDAAAAALGAVTAIALALHEFGGWSLIAQQVVVASSRLVGNFYYGGFWPKLTFNSDYLKTHFHFGRDTLAVSLCNYVEWQSSTLAIARLLGAAPLALYSMNDRLMRFVDFGVSGPTASVVFLRMSRAKHDPNALANLFLAATRVLALLLIPLLGMTAVAGKAVMGIALSEKWVPVATIFALSAPGIAIRLVTASIDSLLMARGKTWERVKVVSERAVLWVLGLLIVAPFGIEAVAAMRSVHGILYLPRSFMFVLRTAPVSITQFANALLIPTGITLAYASLHLVLCAAFQPSNLEELLMAMTGGLLTLGTICFTWRRQLRTDLHILRE